MHHPISGINSLIHSVSLASHFLIHLSAHLCHHHHSHHPSLLHSFTPGSKPTFSTNPSHLNTFSTLDCLHDHGTGPDLHASRFIFFLFVLCGGLNWVHVSFLLHVQYRIVYEGRGHKWLSRGYNWLDRGHKWLSRRHNWVDRVHVWLVWGHKWLSSGHNWLDDGINDKVRGTNNQNEALIN